MERFPYFGKCIVMTTKHEKSIAVAPGFQEILAAAVAEYAPDTDALGTLSGQVEQWSNALDRARRKCEWGLDLLNADFGIASEGSFGLYPCFPFVPTGFEILYFIDRTRNFHLYVSRLCEKTNYLVQTVDSFEALQRFATKVQFPTHALIVRPNLGKSREVVFKGIDNTEALGRSFHCSLAQSLDGFVRVETDMRAHVNPGRMSEISELARQLARRLATFCPACRAPGWGLVNAQKDRGYEYCDWPTAMMVHEVYGCVLCDHTERMHRRNGLEKTHQMHRGQCHS